MLITMMSNILIAWWIWLDYVAHVYVYLCPSKWHWPFVWNDAYRLRAAKIKTVKNRMLGELIRCNWIWPMGTRDEMVRNGILCHIIHNIIIEPPIRLKILNSFEQKLPIKAWFLYDCHRWAAQYWFKIDFLLLRHSN